MTCFFQGPDCWGGLQSHHLVKQQTIRRRHATLKADHRRGGPAPFGLTAALADDRNLVDLCHFHHGQLHAGKVRLEPSVRAREFAADLGLGWVFEAEERKRVA